MSVRRGKCEHRTPNFQRLTEREKNANIEHRTSNIEHRTSNAELKKI